MMHEEQIYLYVSFPVPEGLYWLEQVLCKQMMCKYKEVSWDNKKVLEQMTRNLDSTSNSNITCWMTFIIQTTVFIIY